MRNSSEESLERDAEFLSKEWPNCFEISAAASEPGSKATYTVEPLDFSPRANYTRSP